MPPFTLAPWELPPDCEAPLTAPADFVFRATWQYGLTPRPRETEIRVRVVPYRDDFLHFFCDGERSQNGNWVLGSSTYFPYSDGVWDLDTLEKAFRHNDDLWYESVSRLLYIEGTTYGNPGLYCLTVRPSNGDCYVQYGLRTFETKDNWRNTLIPSPFKSYRAPTRAVTTRNQLVAALRDPDSKARQALSWLHLKPHERRKQSQEFERKTLAPMMTILQAVLQSQTGIWESGLTLEWSTREFLPQDLARYRSRKWNGNDLYTTRGHTQFLDIPVRMQRWKTLIWNAYIVSPAHEWLLYSDSSGQSEGTVGVIAPPPTDQVSAEALLRLRDWLQQNFPNIPFETQNAAD